MSDIRPSLTAEEAALLQAALLWYRDTYLNDPDVERTPQDEAEASRMSYLCDKVRIRIHGALRRRGYPVVMDESERSG